MIVNIENGLLLRLLCFAYVENIEWCTIAIWWPSEWVDAENGRIEWPDAFFAFAGIYVEENGR